MVEVVKKHPLQLHSDSYWEFDYFCPTCHHLWREGISNPHENFVDLVIKVDAHATPEHWAKKHYIDHDCPECWIFGLFVNMTI